MRYLINLSEFIHEGWKWKPSASQRKEFALRMKDPEEKIKYEQGKIDKQNKRRSKSKFDYNTAGGRYKPTKNQHDFCLYDVPNNLTPEEETACNVVMNGYINNEPVDHDYIHIVNELRRKIKSTNV